MLDVKQVKDDVKYNHEEEVGLVNIDISWFLLMEKISQMEEKISILQVM